MFPQLLLFFVQPEIVPVLIGLVPKTLNEMILRVLEFSRILYGRICHGHVFV